LGGEGVLPTVCGRCCTPSCTTEQQHAHALVNHAQIRFVIYKPITNCTRIHTNAAHRLKLRLHSLQSQLCYEIVTFTLKIIPI